MSSLVPATFSKQKVDALPRSCEHNRLALQSFGRQTLPDSSHRMQTWADLGNYPAVQTAQLSWRLTWHHWFALTAIFALHLRRDIKRPCAYSTCHLNLEFSHSSLCSWSIAIHFSLVRKCPKQSTRVDQQLNMREGVGCSWKFIFKENIILHCHRLRYGSTVLKITKYHKSFSAR